MKGLAPKDLLAEFGIDPLPEAYFGEQEPGGTVFPISKQLVNVSILKRRSPAIAAHYDSCMHASS